MTEKKDLKKLIRDRMLKTGEAYTTARRRYVNGAGDPRAHSRALVELAIQRDPMLTAFGLGVWKQRRMSRVAFDEAFAKGRAELFTDRVLDEVETCAAWLSLQRPIKTLNRERGSHSFKHEVERWVDRTCKEHQYISNGALIAAALGLGFEFKQTEWGSPNVYLNLSKRQLRIVAESGAA